MTTNVAAAMTSGNGRKIKWQGQTVRSILRLNAKEGDQIVVERLSSSATRAQAIKIGIDKGNLRANGVLMNTIAIWSHTSPDQVTIEVVGRRARSIDVWNSWSLDGVDSAWIANAAMTVQSDANEHILRCSDGVGDATFDDLVAKVSIVRNG